MTTPRRIAGELRLGDTTYRITLADENVKVNLNSLYAVGGVREVTDVLYQQVRPQRMLRPPLLVDASQPAQARPYGSWGEVFAWEHAWSPSQLATWLPEQTQHITCFGDGKLNVRLAEDVTLEHACRKLAAPTTIARLLKLRSDEDFSTLELDALLDRLELRASERVKLRAWLCTESRTFSVWLESEKRGTTHLSLAVQSDTPPGDVTFRW